MNILHICSDFAKQRLYAELVAQLARSGVDQSVYVAVRSLEELGRNQDAGLTQVKYHYSYILRPVHRILFKSKIRTVVRDLLQSIDPAAFSLTHAHFLFSDGAVALTLKERFGLPYVVCVRNTDINAFMRLRPDLRGLCWRIVAEARHVIFPTPAYVERLAGYGTASQAQTLRGKSNVVPNGLASYWLQHAGSEWTARDATLRLLYVGDFTKNKNVITTLRAAAAISKTRPVVLTLVGGGGDGESEVRALIESGRFPFVKYRGRIEKPDELRRIYREHDVFVMPSFKETFGIVYLEALSQGLPVVCTRGQGIDGYFAPGTVAEAVDPKDPGSVEQAILRLAARLDSIRPQCVDVVRRFGWPEVASEYLKLYADTVVSAKRIVA